MRGIQTFVYCYWYLIISNRGIVLNRGFQTCHSMLTVNDLCELGLVRYVYYSVVFCEVTADPVQNNRCGEIAHF